MKRRRFLAVSAGGLLLPWLGGCGKSGWPEGMKEIVWDRDTCTRCKMVISDRRFAAELRGGPQDQVFKFDDIGCLVTWLAEQPWGRDAAARIWVADAVSHGETVNWRDARTAYYIGGKTSPMGYNYGAVAKPQAGTFDFAEMSQHILMKRASS